MPWLVISQQTTPWTLPALFPRLPPSHESCKKNTHRKTLIVARTSMPWSSLSLGFAHILVSTWNSFSHFFFPVYWTSTHTFRLNSNVTVPLKLPDMTFPAATCTPPWFSIVLFINQFYHFKHSIIILSWLLLHCIGISFKSRSYVNYPIFRA